MSDIIYKELSYQIVGIMYEVYNELGYGYQEKYYEKAVEKCFKEKNIKYKRQLSCELPCAKSAGRLRLNFK